MSSAQGYRMKQISFDNESVGVKIYRTVAVLMNPNLKRSSIFYRDKSTDTYCYTNLSDHILDGASSRSVIVIGGWAKSWPVERRNGGPARQNTCSHVLDMQWVSEIYGDSLICAIGMAEVSNYFYF